MKRKKIKALTFAILLLGFILGVFGCSITDISNAIDSDLGTDTSEIASQIENYEHLESNHIDYVDIIKKVSAAFSGNENSSLDNKKTPEINASADSSMYVHFIDVGQGDATLIICDHEAMLIDCGDNSKGTLLQNYLKKQGVEKLKFVIGTHPDADHIGGMDVILTKFDCERILMPDITKETATYRDTISAMNYKGYQNTLPYVGDTYSLGSACFTILAPNNYDYGDKTNNYSISIILYHGGNTFLFTGDAEEEAENDMLSNGYSIKADVLHVGHHGSSSSTSDNFLKEVNPSYAVISCGEENDYGHPHAETLNKLRAAGISLFRTDEQGSVIAISDENGITWNCAPSESWQSGR